MGSDWPEISLTALYEISSGLSKSAKDFGSGYPFLSFKDVFYNFFVPDELTELVQSSEKERQACSVKRGDVFLTRTSETTNELGMSSVALKDYENATFNGFTKRLRPKFHDQIVPEYVGYYLRSPKFRAEMLAFSTLSTRASLNNEMIGRLTITLPSTKEQKNISWILKKLDDKIELNRQMNETLLSMAQSLFKSWFVNFDPVIDNALAAGNPIPETFHSRAKTRKALGEKRKFLPEAIQKQFPNRFVFSEEMGWIPEGWLVLMFREFTAEVKTKVGELDVPEYSSTNGGLIPRGDSFQKQLSMDKGRNKLIRYGDIVFGMSRQVLNFGVMHEPIGSVSSAYKVFHVDNLMIYPEYVEQYIRMRENIYFNMLGSSSREGQSLSKNSFYATKMLIPSKNIQQSFQGLVGFIDKIKLAREESQTLINIRDILLSKLLSGQLRIPDAEKLMADAL